MLHGNRPGEIKAHALLKNELDLVGKSWEGNFSSGTILLSEIKLYLDVAIVQWENRDFFSYYSISNLEITPGQTHPENVLVLTENECNSNISNVFFGFDIFELNVTIYLPEKNLQ